MHPSPEEPTVAVLAPDPSRRGALRALGAAGMALAGAVGLGHAPGVVLEADVTPPSARVACGVPAPGEVRTRIA